MSDHEHIERFHPGYDCGGTCAVYLDSAVTPCVCDDCDVYGCSPACGACIGGEGKPTMIKGEENQTSRDVPVEKNTDPSEAGKGHRGVPGVETKPSLELNADHAFDHAFEPNQQCSGLTCEICGNNKEWHDKRDESLRRRRALMPDYDKKLEDWLS